MTLKKIITHLGLATLLVSCTSTADNAAPVKDEYITTIDAINTDFHELFLAARFADSSHNVQPWRVTIEDHSTLFINAEPKRSLPEVDPENREILLSLGGFIENIVQTANALGYSAEVELLLQEPFDERIARISLNKTSTKVDREKLNCIKSVYTEKTHLSTETLGSHDIGRLRGETEHILHFPSGSPEVKYVHQEAPKAAVAQAERDPVQHELVELMHFSKKSTDKKGIGMTPEMMGLSGIARFVWYSFFTPSTMLKDSNRKTIGTIVSRQLKNSGGILVITSETRRVEDLIEAGRRYQRIKIEAFRREIIIHPLSQLLEEEEWKRVINRRLDVKRPIQYIARVGYRKGKPIDFETDAVTSASIRMETSQFVSVKG